MCQRPLVQGLFLWSLSQAAQAAMSVQGGESLIEQGDFLLHPGVQLGLGWEEGNRVRVDFTGRRFGSFLETTTMVSWDRPFSVFPWPELTARYGLTLLDAYVAYKPKSGATESSHDLNAGVTLGLAYQIWSHDRWRVNAEWNSHIYAAGLAIILLTTARKSVFTIGAEVSL